MSSIFKRIQGMHQEQQLIPALRNVRIIRGASTLLGSTDILLGKNYFLGYAAQETLEMEEELSEGQIDPKKVQDELNDVLVLTQTGLNISQSRDLSFAVEKIPLQKGALSSNSLEKLHEYVLDLQDSSHALPEILGKLLLVLETFPSGVTIPDGMMKTIQKVLANRPPELYSNSCPIKGKQLNEYEEVNKYQYLEKATRLIRNRCGNRMKPQHWQPIERLMHDFYNAEYNLKNLETALQMMSIEDFTQRGWGAGDAFVWKTLNGIIAEAGGVLRYHH